MGWKYSMSCDPLPSVQNENLESFKFCSLTPNLKKLFILGLSEWEDAGIIAQVLAASQQEYLDDLKKAHDASCKANMQQHKHDCDLGGPSTSS